MVGSIDEDKRDNSVEIVVQKPRTLSNAPKRKSRQKVNKAPNQRTRTTAPAPSTENRIDINSDWLAFLIFAVITCLITLVFFCGYGIPMFLLETISSGASQKVIVTPFSDYSSEYHVAHPCIYPPFFEPLEGSFACNNTG